MFRICQLRPAFNAWLLRWALRTFPAALCVGVATAAENHSVFRSEDQTRSWQPAPTPGTASVRILCFATLGHRVFAGTDGSGILAS